MQQKQELWKMSLSATSRSMGYTVFWHAAQLSFTWARRLKDCPGKRVSQGPDPCPFLLPPNTPLSGPYLGALDSAAATAAFGFLRDRASQGQVRGMPQTIAAVTSPDPRSVGGGMGQRVVNLPPLTPSPPGQMPAEEEPSRPADHLHERGWPGRLLQPGTWLGGGDGGPRWRRGTRWVLQGEVGRSGPTSSSPACRVGWECLQAGGWGAAVGTFPKSFPVALGLATSAPHPPPPSPARPPRCSPRDRGT